MKWELWHSIEGQCYSMFPEDTPAEKRILEPDAELIHVIEADTYNEAAKQKHEYLGWEPYKPMD